MNTHIYENGFRLVHEKPNQRTSHLASVQVICGVGSVYESDECRGASHFIEHMCFKGTHKLPKSKDVSIIFDKTGSYLNAFTSRRYTCYYTDTIDDHVEISIKTFSDMLLNSTFVKSEYEKEKDVVREEMIKDEDDSELLVLDNADFQIYAGSPYKHPVDNMRFHVGKDALKYEDILSLYRRFYKPSNMILSVCSNHSFSDIRRFVSKSFFKTSTATQANPPILVLSIEPQPNIVYKIQSKPGISTAHICIGFRTCSITNPDKYALKILKNILSGKMTSRLFTILREENGLTYSSYAYSDYFEHIGDFKIYAECDAEKVFRNGVKLGVYPLLVNLIKSLINTGVTDEEIRISKNNLRGSMIQKMEDPSIIAKYNAKNILFNIENTPSYQNKYNTYIDPVSKTQINNCIRKYFIKENAVVSIVCPPKGTPAFTAALKSIGSKPFL